MNIMKATTHAINQAASQEVSDVIDHQTRMVTLLFNEGISHCDPLLRLIQQVNRFNPGKELKLFQHLENARNEICAFQDEAGKYYPELKKYWDGNAISTDAFTEIMQAIFGYDFEGKKQNEWKLIFVAPEEINELNEYLERKKKVKAHYKKMESTELFKRQGFAACIGGWNAQTIYQYNDNNEWRKFDSITDAVKATGLNRKKITTAINTETEYKGWNWVTERKFKELVHEHKIVIPS